MNANEEVESNASQQKQVKLYQLIQGRAKKFVLAH